MAKVLTEAAEPEIVRLLIVVLVVVVVILVTTYCFFFRFAKLCGMHCCWHRSKVVRVYVGRRGSGTNNNNNHNGNNFAPRVPKTFH